MKRQRRLTLDDAEAIAIAALGHLGGDADRLQRFLADTGLDPAELRERAAEPDVLAAVLEHVLGDETLLLVIAANAQIAPEQVAPAAALLAAEIQRRSRA